MENRLELNKTYKMKDSTRTFSFGEKEGKFIGYVGETNRPKFQLYGNRVCVICNTTEFEEVFE